MLKIDFRKVGHNATQAGILGSLFLTGLIMTGCGREQIQVNQVPKEAPAAEAPPQMGSPQQAPEGHMPAGHMPVSEQITGKVPSDWQSQASDGMRTAHYIIQGKDGANADVSVIPLAGIAAGQVEIVNLWRKQLQLDPIGEAEIKKAAEPVDVGTTKADMFDLTSTALLIDSKTKARILVATLSRGGTSWFFKMSGPDGLVGNSKTAFLDYLKSIEFQKPALAVDTSSGMGAMPMGMSAPAADPSGKPKWTVPAGWQEQPPTQMLMAKFQIAGSTIATVSSLGGSGGGLLPNINRWRGQLGVGPVTEDELSKFITSIELPSGKATEVDMTGADGGAGQKKRLVAVIISASDRTWFYKLMGDDNVVEQHKAEFVQFVQSAK